MKHNLLLQDIQVWDPGSPHHGEVVSIRISEGQLVEIGKDVPEGDARCIPAAGWVACPGWMDTWVQAGEPGLEHRETLTSVTAAAARGGFVELAILPNTAPAIDNKSGVTYILRQTADQPVMCYPLAAVSQNARGTHITEMYDMHRAGAIGFTNGIHPIASNGHFLRVLQYVKAFDSLILHQPFDADLAPEGQVHEGAISTRLGLKGIPSLAESMVVQRDLWLAEMAQSRLHLANISCRQSVDLIREAKARGIQVTASVPVLNLLFTHEKVADFDNRYKVLPPLREETDRLALLQGLREGVIDCISSNHIPWDQESWQNVFPLSAFGATGLETTFAACRSLLKEELPLEVLLSALGNRSRGVFGFPEVQIVEGQSARLTLFHPEKEWTYSTEVAQTRGMNTPFLNQSFTGQVTGIVNQNQWMLF